MRKVFKWLSLLAWIGAALVLESGTSAQSAGASTLVDESQCGVAAQGKSFDANTMTCVGAGGDCKAFEI